ncbi:MAG: hypothetical protein GY788_29650, partial [bacterium]|nr:hypothetical protein [bacterium]
MSSDPAGARSEGLPPPTSVWRLRVNGMFVVGCLILAPLVLMALSASYLTFLDPTSINASQK